MKKWTVKNNKVNTDLMAKSLGITEVLAQILANRGIGTAKGTKRFINADLSELHDGYLFKDMKKAIGIVNLAIENKTKIAVYGDYDVDGVTSSVILYKAIKTFTSEVIYYVPHRQKEGYGINMSSIDELQQKGIGLIVCCDNGIAAVEEAKMVKKLGMSLVIIDHHDPAFEEDEDGTKRDIIPIADAVVDAKQRDCKYPFKFLCAGGMAYKFSKLLFESRNEKFAIDKELLVFAAIATICDIVDLLDENRIIAQNGLKLIKESGNVGLQALLEETKLNEADFITEYHVGFILGPCINATGRLESAGIAIELFLSEDKEKAKQLATELTKLNEDRKYMTTTAVESCMKTIESQGLSEQNVLVVLNEEIHESIAGIVAGRIKERYYKPTIVLTEGDGMVKGSARSIEGYNVFEELLKLKDLFQRFGGHPMAAGLTLPKENVEELRKKINKNCRLTEKELTPVLRLEKALNLSEITMDLAKELNNVAPFGKENPVPIFGTKCVLAEKVSVIGKNQNILKFSLRDTQTGTRLDGISFDGFEEFSEQCNKKYGEEEKKHILQGTQSITLDIAYTIDINTFMGNSKVQLIIKDFRI